MLRWLTIAATAGVIAVNGLANALPIGGKTTGEISDGFDILFTPAGYVFSIWGLIYLALTAFTVVQALPSRHARPVFAEIRPWYLLNTVANAAWILAWHHEHFALTLGLMLVILGSLVVIVRRIVARGDDDWIALALVRAPFSLYLGWISVATIANVTVVLAAWGATEPLADPTVTLGILIAATVLCIAVSRRLADPVYAAVFVWALIGIATKHSDITALSVGALVLAGVCMVAAAVAAAGAVSVVRNARA